MGKGLNRFATRRQVAVALHLSRGEDLELLSRAPSVTAARLSKWRKQFVTRAGQAVLQKRYRAARDLESGRLHQKLGEVTLNNGLLQKMIGRLGMATICHGILWLFLQPVKLDSQLPGNQAQGLTPGNAPHHFRFSGCVIGLPGFQKIQLSLLRGDSGRPTDSLPSLWVHFPLHLARIPLVILSPVLFAH